MNSPNKYMKQIRGQSKIKEFWNAIKYFLGVELFVTAMMLSFGLGEKIIIQMFIGVPPLFILARGGKNAKLGVLYYICLLFVLGQRTVWLGTDFRVVPSAIILWGLALISLSAKPAFRVPGKALPFSILLLSAASAFAIFLESVDVRGLSINGGFGYAHMMWMSIPAFFICHKLVYRLETVQNIVTILSFECIFLSFLGIAEYYGLGFVHHFAGFMKGQNIMSQEGTYRMAATFWGNSHLASFLGMCFPLIMAQAAVSKTVTQKVLSLLSLSLTFVAIYLSGHRGVWVPVLLGIVIYFYLKGARGLVILFIFIIVGVNFIPKEAKTRFSGLTGKHRDSSSIKREDRVRQALELIMQNPIVGYGWYYSGLVHSDPIQIWADTGLAGLIGFLGAFFSVWRRLFRVIKIRDKLYREYSSGFLISTIISFTILVQQTWMNLPEEYTPFWIIMGLAYQFSNIVFIERVLIAQKLPSSNPETGESEKHA